MASLSTVELPDLVRRRRCRANDNYEWPQGSAYCEETYATLGGTQFLTVARSLARQLPDGDNPAYVKWIADEARDRLRPKPLFVAVRPFLPDHKAPAETEVMRSHARALHREMAWEREKWTHQLDIFQWRQFGQEPEFQGWLGSVPDEMLAQWADVYLPELPRAAASLIRQQLCRLTPMPRAVSRAYFLGTTTDVRLQALVGVRSGLSLPEEHQICLLCQRLLAYHTVKHSRYSPSHVAALHRVLTRHLNQSLRYRRDSAELLEIANTACLGLQGRLSKNQADTGMGVVRQALERAQQVLRGSSAMPEGMQSLHPTVLAMLQPCATCQDRKSVEPVELELPPFHQGCQCFRLAWRSEQLPELERKVTLWAIETAIDGTLSRFPFDEFIKVCCSGAAA